MILVAVLAAYLALAQAQGGPAPTLPQASPRVAATGKLPGDGGGQPDSKQVCVREETTGTLLGHRTCHTAAEWRAMQKERDSAPDGGRVMPYPRVR